MKKIITTFLLLVVCVMTMSAKSLEVKEGSTAVLKENATAEFVLDLDHCTFERKQDFKAWCGKDYDVRVSLMKDFFPEYFNEYSKGLKIVTDNTPAKYKMVLHVDEFERKTQSIGALTACMKIHGELSVIEKETGKTVLKIEVHLKGSYDYVETDRFTKAMKALAKQLPKMK
mgnify:CR=1 FL=1